MIKIVGVDPGISTGLVVYDYCEQSGRLHLLHNSTIKDRTLKQVANLIYDFSHNCHYFVLEDFIIRKGLAVGLAQNDPRGFTLRLIGALEVLIEPEILNLQLPHAQSKDVKRITKELGYSIENSDSHQRSANAHVVYFILHNGWELNKK